MAAGITALAPTLPASGTGWRPVGESPVTATNLLEPQAKNSPTLAVDPTDRRFVVVAHRVDGPRLFDCGLHVSGDAGRTWQPARPVPELPEGVDRCYAPEVAFEPGGALHYLFVGLHGPDNRPRGAYVATSVDRGRSFGPPRQVLGGGLYSVRMAIDHDGGRHGRMHLAWVEPTTPPATGGFTGSTRVMAAHSDDGGRSLSPPVVVSDPDRHRVVAPALAPGPGGAVHVAYYDLGDDARDFQGLEGPVWEGTWSIVLGTSVDRGRSFADGLVVDAAVVPPERVMLVFTMAPPALAAGRSGEVYVAWTDRRLGDWDVWLVRMGPPAGEGAEPAARRLNDDPVGSGSAQYLPAVSVAPGGRVDVAFYDRRDDRSGRRNHVYFTSSTDGGRTFSSNRRLTSEAFFWEAGVTYPLPSAQGLVEFGSRTGLVSSDDGALAAWTDTRMFNQGNRLQDVYSAHLALETPGAGTRRPLVAGLAAVALAAALAAAASAARRSGPRRPRRGSQP